MDFQAIKFAAEKRVERDSTLDYARAIKAVIADCLAKNEDPGHVPTGVFMDWNWYRLDFYKAYRGDPMPRGVPLAEFMARLNNPKLAKAA